MAASPAGARAGPKKRKKPPRRQVRLRARPPREAKRLRFRTGQQRRRWGARASRRRPYNFVVSEMLRQLHRDRAPISAEGRGAMISYVRRVYNEVVAAARCHRRGGGGRCVIGLKELQAALRRVMPQEGAEKLAVEEGRDAS